MKRLVRLGCLLACCALPALAADPPADPLPELRDLFAAGKCDELVERARQLGAAVASNPDALVLEANCLVRQARTATRVFDGARYERMKIARGAAFVPPELTERFYVTRVTWDPAKRDEALALFRRALTLAPDRGDLVAGNVAALLDAERPDDALALLEDHARTLRERDLDDLLQAAQDLLRRGRGADAERLARTLRKVAPRRPQGPMAEAVVLLDRFDTRGAIRALLDAHRLAPRRPDVTGRLGFLLAMARDWKEASRVLATSVGEDRPLWLAWLAVARGRLAPGSDRPLWNDLRENLAKAKDAPPALVELTKHRLALLESGRTPRPSTRVNAARWFLGKGLPVAAVAELDEALAAERPPFAAYEEMLALLRKQGLLDLAAELCREGIDAIGAGKVVLDDGNPAGREQRAVLTDGLARVLYGMSRDEEALAAAKRARELGNPDPLLEGLALEALGRTDAAVAAFREAAAGEGDDAGWAKARLARLAPAGKEAGENGGK